MTEESQESEEEVEVPSQEQLKQDVEQVSMWADEAKQKIKKKRQIHL